MNDTLGKLKTHGRRRTVEHVFLRFELERCYCSDDEPDPLSKHLDQDRWRFRRFTNTIVTIGLLGPLCQGPLWMIRFEDVSFPLEADWKSVAIDSAIDSVEFVWCCLRQKFTLTFVSFCIPCFAVVYPFGAAAGLAIRCPCRRWTKFVWCTFSVVWRETLRTKMSIFLIFFQRFSQRFSQTFLDLAEVLAGRSGCWGLGTTCAQPASHFESMNLEIGFGNCLQDDLLTKWDVILTRKQRNMSLLAR